MTRRLETSRARFYKQLVRVSPGGLAILHLKDPKNGGAWELVAINSTASEVAGSSVADFLDLPILAGDAQTSHERLGQLYRQVIQRRRPWILGQFRKTRRFRSPQVYAVKACPLPGECVGVLFEDASQLSATTRELVKAEALLKQISERAGAIIWRADPVTLEFTYLRPQAPKVLGYWVERWLHETNFWKTHMHAEDWELVKRRCGETALKGVEAQFDCRMFSASGDLRWFHVCVQKTEMLGHTPELTGVMVDITERKDAELAARDLSAKVMRAQEQERKRVSRELHDSVGQYLTGIKCILAGLRDRKDCGEELREKLKECSELTAHCLEDVRSVSHMLHPPELEMLGLVPAIRSYGQRFAERTGIRLDLNLPEKPERLESDTELALFRIVQESLTNIQRHAQSEIAQVRLDIKGDSVTLEIGDSGKGMAPGLVEQLEQGRPGGGIGLLKMRERILELGGRLEIRSNGRGTLIRVQTPRHGGRTAAGNAARPEAPASDTETPSKGSRNLGPRGRTRCLAVG